MKPFKFTLQPLKTLRQRQEQRALEAYARALLERTRAAEEVRAADCMVAQARAAWRQLSDGGCAAIELARQSAHCRELAERRKDRQSALEAAERLANSRLQDVLRARQQLQTVEKFLKRRRADYDRAAAREDQKFLDELAQRRAEFSLAFNPGNLPAHGL